MFILQSLAQSELYTAESCLAEDSMHNRLCWSQSPNYILYFLYFHNNTIYVTIFNGYCDNRRLNLQQEYSQVNTGGDQWIRLHTEQVCFISNGNVAIGRNVRDKFNERRSRSSRVNRPGRDPWETAGGNWWPHRTAVVEESELRSRRKRVVGARHSHREWQSSIIRAANVRADSHCNLIQRRRGRGRRRWWRRLGGARGRGSRHRGPADRRRMPLALTSLLPLIPDT